MPGSTCCSPCRHGNVCLNYAYRHKYPVRGARVYHNYKAPHTKTYVTRPATRPTNRYAHHTDWHNRHPQVSYVQYKTHGSYARS